MTTTRGSVAELVGELAIADIDRDHRDGAALKQAIRETSGRRPDVEASQTADVESKGIERARKLRAPSRYERVIGDAHDDIGVLGDKCSGLVDARARDEHFP